MPQMWQQMPRLLKKTKTKQKQKTVFRELQGFWLRLLVNLT